jgi:hypothetical protein
MEVVHDAPVKQLFQNLEVLLLEGRVRFVVVKLSRHLGPFTLPRPSTLIPGLKPSQATAMFESDNFSSVHAI